MAAGIPQPYVSSNQDVALNHQLSTHARSISPLYFRPTLSRLANLGICPSGIGLALKDAELMALYLETEQRKHNGSPKKHQGR